MKNSSVLLTLFLSVFVLSACSVKPSSQPSVSIEDIQIEPVQSESNDLEVGENTIDEGAVMQITELVGGNGAEAKKGDNVRVHYTGTFTNGEVFDSSVTRGQPFTFTLGAGQVIEGWDQGVAGMKVGGKRQLTIPPELAYGERGVPGAIPPNSTLIFEVELLGIE